MKNRIFKSTFLVAILVWLACMTLILGALYMQYSKEYHGELKNEAYLLAHAVEVSGQDYLEELKPADGHRISWIAADGRVKYDSSTDAAEMENHRKRPEVTEALKNGYGEDARYSKTLAEKTVYSAVRLNDGTVLRISQTRVTVLSLLLEMIRPILGVLILAVILSFVLSVRTARKIVEPLNRIDPENPGQTEVYEEVRPLIQKITEQHDALNQKINRLMIDVDEKTREADFRKEFTANVSHELKTPLTSISGFAELMKNDLVKSEDIPRFAGRIYDEAQRLIALVEDIIKLSQLDEKAVIAKKEKVDLYTTCKEALYILEPAAREKKLKVSVTGEHIYIEAVQQILGEIVYNLCDNAIKYNRVEGALTVTVFEEDGRPAVSVADTGIGIPREDLDRVFERFYRVNKSHSKEIGGTGLGLSIVKHGAAYHNARIKIDSELGIGTTITIIF